MVGKEKTALGVLLERKAVFCLARMNETLRVCDSEMKSRGLAVKKVSWICSAVACCCSMVYRKYKMAD